MRRKYRQDRATGALYEVVDARSHKILILPDIEPYESTITGEVISSRSKHREHLRIHDCQEVGDNIPKFLREKYEREGERPQWGRDGRRVG